MNVRTCKRDLLVGLNKDIEMHKFSMYVQCYHKVSNRREIEGHRRKPDSGNKGQRMRERFEDTMRMALKMKEGAEDQGKKVAFRSCKKQRSGLSARVCRKN